MSFPDGGPRLSWSPDRSELFTLDVDLNLLVSDVARLEAGGIETSDPCELFRTNWHIGRTYDVITEQEDRENGFLFVDSGSEHETSFAVVSNWQAALGAIVERRHLRAGTR